MSLAIAHRGEPVGHRENTIPAFEAAARLGADMIELDCRLTSDRAVVVLHDRTLHRLWGVPQAVDELPLVEVAALGEGAQRVPLLSEVLEAVALPVMVDVADPAVMAPALDEVRRTQALERCLFVGNLRALQWLRSAEPAARIGLTWPRRRPPSWRLLDELRPEYFNPRFDLLGPARIEAFHRRGYAVSAWTVDDAAAMARLLDEGVDALITNQIARLCELLATRPPGGRAAGGTAGA